jgi:hypothetical protein
VPHPKGFVRIWQIPEAGRRYLAFVDPMGEPNEDEWDARPERDKQDYACVQVIDLDSGAQVAEWHGRLAEPELAKEAAKLGYIYGKAQIVVERGGGYGTTCAHVLDREIAYWNLYRQEEFGKTRSKPTTLVGWRTSEHTRPQMIEALRSAIVEVSRNPRLLPFEGLLGELRTCVVNRRGKPEHAPGCHDDRVMALAGALAVRMRGDSVIRLRPAPKPKKLLTGQRRRLDRAPRVRA